MKVVAAASEAAEAMESAAREAQASVRPARDLSGALPTAVPSRDAGAGRPARPHAVAGERDCSAQRRHQKLIEEARRPASRLDAAWARPLSGLRRLGGGSTPGRHLRVRGDPRRRVLLPGNQRRLQVEHPVTELVTGIDIVAGQITSRRRAARLPPGRHSAERPRHRGPHQRRGPQRRPLLPFSGHADVVPRRALGPAYASMPLVRRHSRSTTTTSSPK